MSKLKMIESLKFAGQLPFFGEGIKIIPPNKFNVR